MTLLCISLCQIFGLNLGKTDPNRLLVIVKIILSLLIRHTTSSLILAAVRIYFNLARLRAGVIKREVRSINLANRVWSPHKTQTLTI